MNNFAHRSRALSLAVVASLLLAACASDPDTSTDSDAGDAPAQEAAVQMADIAFSPASVSATAGSTITWTNEDTVPHTVSFGDAGPTSDTIEPAGTFETTFDEPGSYPYVCTIHPGMDGTVEVAA
ncbi:MAG TPA: cupredoxin domain-containing protein [Euzebya sp.]|nr:cupredoxin domain-containing protein [Euzebya sp.]